MFLSTLGLNEDERQQLEKLITVPVVHKKIKDMSQEELSQVEAVFSYGYDLPEPVMTDMKNLKWIHIGQSGMEYLPAETIKNRGISLTNSRGLNATNISEHILTVMLNHVRKTWIYRAKQEIGEWDSDTRMGELRDSFVAVLGLGMAGKEVVKRCLAFDMNVYGMDVYNPKIPGIIEVFTPDKVKEIISIADFVVLTMPLTKSTYHIINDDSLSVAKSNMFLINTGRGGLVDIEALKKAIKENKISGASLDVFDKEPLGKESELWNFDPRLEITPHIAGDHFTAYGKRMIQIMSENINSYPCFDKMINKVNVDSLL